MIQEILGLSKVLMVVPSIKDDNKAIDLALEIAQEELHGFPVKRYEKNNAPSLLYSNHEWKEPRFKIILNTNLDVVEAHQSFFRPYIKDGKLYGRGAYAMKAPAAAMIFAFKHVASKLNYPLALQIVTDEETGGENGTKYQIEQGVRADFVVTSASSNFTITNETKGVMWVKIASKGEMAHTAYPWKGKNAVAEMKDFLNKIEQFFPVPEHEVWETTVVISHINTKNNTFNNIPEDCEAWLDIRYITKDKDTVLEKIKELLPSNFTLQIELSRPAQYTPINNPYIQQLSGIFKEITGENPEIMRKNFVDELGHFYEVGVHGVGFSPIGGDSHTAHEWVDIQSVNDYYQILKKFLLSLNENK